MAQKWPTTEESWAQFDKAHEEIPKQIDEAIARFGSEAKAQIGNIDQSKIRNVLFIGQGVGRTTGMLTSRLIQDHGRIPSMVSDGYRLPNHVDSGTLIVATSSSGTSEETLATTAQALAKGAQVLAVTKADGPLAKMIQEKGRGAIIAPDPKISIPRIAWPSVLVSHTLAMVELGILPAQIKTWVDELGKTVGPRLNDNEALLNELADRFIEIRPMMPYVMASDHLREIPERFFDQISENVAETVIPVTSPDGFHNSTVAMMDKKRGDLPQKTLVMLLSGVAGGEHERNTIRRAYLKNGFVESGGKYYELGHKDVPNRLADMVLMTADGDSLANRMGRKLNRNVIAIDATSGLKDELGKHTYDYAQEALSLATPALMVSESGQNSAGASSSVSG